MNDTYDEHALAHYGVLGMKWGVRNDDKKAGPSLTREQKKAVREKARAAKRETKAKKFDLKASVYQTKIKDLDKAPLAWYNTRKAVARDRKGLIKDLNRAKKDAALVRQGKMTTGEKKLLIGASVTAAVVAAFATYRVVDSGDATRLIAKGKAHLDGKAAPEFDKMKAYATPNLPPSVIKSVVVEGINPNYGLPGTLMNCRRSTFAYEMRRRGYDVRATKSLTGTGQNIPGMENATTPGLNFPTSIPGVLTKFVSESIRTEGETKNSPFLDMMTKRQTHGHNSIERGSHGDATKFENDIFATLRQLPNGARGELGMTWRPGGGHSMAWEIVNGAPVIFDTQSNKMYQNEAEFANMASMMRDAGFTRLDNIELNKDFLLRWLTNSNG